MSSTVTSTTTTTAPLVANNVLHLFPEVDTGLATSTAAQGDDLIGYDEEQVRLMEEVCIVLDENDMPIGSASKKTCMLFSGKLDLDGGSCRAYNQSVLIPT